MWLFIAFSAFLLYLRWDKHYFQNTFLLLLFTWNVLFGNYQDVFSNVNQTGLPPLSNMSDIFNRLLGVSLSIFTLLSFLYLCSKIKIFKENSLIFGLIVLSILLESIRYIPDKSIACTMIAFFSKSSLAFIYLLKKPAHHQTIKDNVLSVGLCSPMWAIFGRSLVIPTSPNTVLEDRPQSRAILNEFRAKAIKVFFISTYSIIILDILFVRLFNSPFSFFDWNPGLVSVINLKKEYSFEDVSTSQLWLVLIWVSTFSYILIASSWNLAISLANFMGIKAELYWGNLLKAKSVSQIITNTMKLNVRIIHDLFFIPIWSDLKYLKKFARLRIFVSIFLSVFLADIFIHLFRDFNYIYHHGLYKTLRSLLSLWGINLVALSCGLSLLFKFAPSKKWEQPISKIIIVAFVLLFLGLFRITDAPTLESKIKILERLIGF